jgi:hypothetical protein
MLQMSDWLADLGDDAGAEVPTGRHARPASARGPRPERSAAIAPGRPIAPVETIPPAEAMARAEARARARASARAEAMVRAEVVARAQAMARAEARARARVTGRAVIGDELRIPVMWCELGACISRHSDPAALGEADIRGRAIAAGWRVDALGRLVCPRCQQSDGRFWATHPVALHDRDAAVTLAALMAAAAALRDDAADAGSAVEAGVSRAAGPPLVPLPAPGWHREPVSRSGRARHVTQAPRAAASAVNSAALPWCQ